MGIKPGLQREVLPARLHPLPGSVLTFLLPCEEKLCECRWRLPPLRSSCGFQTSPLSLPTDLVGETPEFSRIPLCTISSVHVRRRLHRYSSVSLSTTSKRVSVSTALMRCTTWKGGKQLSGKPGTSWLWQELDPRTINSPTLSRSFRLAAGREFCCRFQLSVMGEKGRAWLWGTPRMKHLLPAAPGDDGDASFHPMPCNRPDSSAQGHCTNHPGSPALLRQELSRRLLHCPPSIKNPAAWFCSLEGQHNLSHQANSLAHPHFLDLTFSPDTHGRVEIREAQGGTKHPRMHSLAGLPLLGALHPTGVPATPHPGWIYEGNNPICTFIPSLC